MLSIGTFPTTILGIALAILIIPLAIAAAGDDGGSFSEAHAAWRTERIEKLKAPQGWLRLAGLLWLKDGANTIGSSEGSDVRFPQGGPTQIGKLTVADGEYTLELAEGLDATVGGEAFRKRQLTSDIDSKTPPDVVIMKRFSFKVIIRNDKPAVRLYDDEAKTLTGFTGIDAFPLDPAWRVEARYERFDPPKIVPVSTAISTTQSVSIPGRFHFRIGEKDLTLDPFEYPGAEELYLMFGDKTNGKTTYGGGRFVLVPRPEGDSAVLDFNRAYNPPCAYSAFATCPLPRKENRLTIPVTAGEKFVDPDHP